MIARRALFPQVVKANPCILGKVGTRGVKGVGPMVFLITLVAAFLVCVAAHDLIRKYPAAFYTMILLLVAAFYVTSSMSLPGAVKLPILLLVKKCYLATALFVVVMFTGALPRTSKASACLRPIRAEISIAACLACSGHVIDYALAFFPRAFTGAIANQAMYAGLLVAVVLVVLLAVLGVTSLRAVKRVMSQGTWKRVQMLAYPFYGLVFAHVLLMLLPSAMSGSAAGIENIAAYSAVFVAYAIARLCRARADRAQAKA